MAKSRSSSEQLPSSTPGGSPAPYGFASYYNTATLNAQHAVGTQPYPPPRRKKLPMLALMPFAAGVHPSPKPQSLQIPYQQQQTQQSLQIPHLQTRQQQHPLQIPHQHHHHHHQGQNQQHNHYKFQQYQPPSHQYQQHPQSQAQAQPTSATYTPVPPSMKTTPT
ncbi:unnamed protein product [Periconia digitata]|uniref:Uncharacterized protein n=1 Tax=Periconia digitata TaxID=1303443 RepID=A0A9W4UNX4_9PLEO|nr:unnamed protein product [Periconia digitata]